MPYLLPWLNLFYYGYLPILSLLYEIMVGLPVMGWQLARGLSLAGATRRHNQRFGRFIVRGLWPMLRYSIAGVENFPRGACVLVANHRSFADIFFVSMVPVPEAMVMVRSWPFRLWVLGWYMRLAGYIDIERTPMGEIIDRIAPDLIRRGVSFLFYPEGHRSRDGRLQRFRSGAFRLAAAHGLPVVPVLIRGSEGFAHPRWPLLQPCRVRVQVLPPLDPAAFPEENRMLKLKRAVENLYREQLGE